MTRKHFEALALAVSELDVTHEDRVKVAHALARACAPFNPLFDTARFAIACMTPEDLASATVRGSGSLWENERLTALSEGQDLKGE